MYNQNNNENINKTTMKTSNENFAKDKEEPKNIQNVPNISLPKGGGAIKSIDEKFLVNASNGYQNLYMMIREIALSMNIYI